MSTAELPAPPRAASPRPPERRPAPAVAWLRLLRSELRLIFLRWRNLILLAVLAAIPVLVGIALRLAGPARVARARPSSTRSPATGCSWPSWP